MKSLIRSLNNRKILVLSMVVSIAVTLSIFGNQSNAQGQKCTAPGTATFIGSVPTCDCTGGATCTCVFAAGHCPIAPGGE